MLPCDWLGGCVCCHVTGLVGVYIVMWDGGVISCDLYVMCIHPLLGCDGDLPSCCSSGPAPGRPFHLL